MGSKAMIYGNVILEEDGTIHLIRGSRILSYKPRVEYLLELCRDIVSVVARRAFKDAEMLSEEIKHCEKEIDEYLDRVEWYDPALYKSEGEMMDAIERSASCYLATLERKYKRLENLEQRYLEVNSLGDELMKIVDKLVRILNDYKEVIDNLE